jgi:biotin operon repressor
LDGRLVLDAALAPASLKVAGAIGTHFGNKFGMTYVSIKKIALVTGLSEATVKRAIIDLEERGYVIIQRREIGERIDGRKVYGGKGVANVYLPAVNQEQISATNRGQKLAEMVKKSWEDIQNEATPKQVTDDLLNDPQAGQIPPLSRSLMTCLLFLLLRRRTLRARANRAVLTGSVPPAWC